MCRHYSAFSPRYWRTAAPSYDTISARDAGCDTEGAHTEAMLTERHEEAVHHHFAEIAAAGLTPARLEQFRLERLLELRAVIGALRVEYRAPPPSDRHLRGRTDSR